MHLYVQYVLGKGASGPLSNGKLGERGEEGGEQWDVAIRSEK